MILRIAKTKNRGGKKQQREKMVKAKLPSQGLLHKLWHEHLQCHPVKQA
jgi:hypothetical protein